MPTIQAVKARRVFNSRGTPTIEINPAETAVSHVVDIKLPAGGAIALDALWQRVTKR